MVVVKCCSGCGVVKSLDDFRRNRAMPDGRMYQCKECASAYERRWREKNRDKVLERSRRWMEGNRDKVSEKNRRYYEENRDKELERGRQYREENQEYMRRLNSRDRSRRKSATKSAATKRGPWSGAEIAILMADDGRTMVSKALELGRTYTSCQGKRARLRRNGVTN